MDEQTTSRRTFLGVATASAAGVLLLAGCGGGMSEEEIRRIEAEAEKYDHQLACTDTSALPPGDRGTRTSNEYVDRSTKPGQHCFNCRNFRPPDQPGTCGTCTTVKGPIHPLGYCIAWIRKG